MHRSQLPDHERIAKLLQEVDRSDKVSKRLHAQNQRLTTELAELRRALEQQKKENRLLRAPPRPPSPSEAPASAVALRMSLPGNYKRIKHANFTLPESDRSFPHMVVDGVWLIEQRLARPIDIDVALVDERVGEPLTERALGVDRQAGLDLTLDFVHMVNGEATTLSVNKRDAGYAWPDGTGGHPRLCESPDVDPTIGRVVKRMRDGKCSFRIRKFNFLTSNLRGATRIDRPQIRIRVRPTESSGLHENEKLCFVSPPFCIKSKLKPSERPTSLVWK